MVGGGACDAGVGRPSAVGGDSCNVDVDGRVDVSVDVDVDLNVNVNTTVDVDGRVEDAGRRSGHGRAG
jgi:hypothetical protein